MITRTRLGPEGHQPTGLLPRMRSELLDRGTFRPRVAAQMYVAYGAHAGLTAVAARRRQLSLPIPDPAAQVTGTLLTGAGGALCLAGMRRFSRPSHVTGTAVEDLITHGIYSYSRNPQYLGYTLVLTGLALARRSGLALLLTGGLAVTYRRWIPTEEQHLQRLFGARYIHYRNSTHRWFGRPQARDGADARTR